ncbi:hypothetical protein [Thiorhodovibrio frisius]|uniref:Uncharacterized protein n=1 Tax=Thiorhodovibrio frisius TaxID=631362 RepID=H8Z8A7_9GAMM|nr:hypothetical protein [Thiorhodovibrio frisius]EIC21056.1 hypothetical protein Thi970DRAFT_04740 [Thiorhodovibrio frisius]WPL22116.1 hypothetical protein Thiofri_02269 [Thiorhodovibrio frisius]
MQDRPTIKTAIPKGRYQIGDYSATLLSEIESPDARTYRYILAFVPDGQREPRLYVCSESAADPAEPRLCHLRVVSETLSEVVDSDARWADADVFAEQALELGIQALGLSKQQAVKLL